MDVNIKRAVTFTQWFSTWMYLALIPSLFLLGGLIPGIIMGHDFMARTSNAVLGAWILPIVCGWLFRLYLRVALPEVAKAWRKEQPSPLEAIDKIPSLGWTSLVAFVGFLAFLAGSFGICLLFDRFGIDSGWPYFAWFVQLTLMGLLVFFATTSASEVVARNGSGMNA